MKNNKLKEFIKKLVKEYTGIGASGGNSTDGNNITSPRPFPDDMSEIENYIYKNVYGAEGGQWVGDKVGSNPNRHPNVRFESLKKYIKNVLDEIKEQAYGSATLTTQGQYGSRFTKTGKPPGIMEDDPEELKEQVSQAAQRTYEAGLKRLQKSVLRYQVRWIEKQRAAAVSQAATAGQEAGKGFDEQIKALKDQIAAIDNPPEPEQQNENLLESYFEDNSAHLLPFDHLKYTPDPNYLWLVTELTLASKLRSLPYDLLLSILHWRNLAILHHIYHVLQDYAFAFGHLNEYPPYLGVSHTTSQLLCECNLGGKS